MDFYTFINSIKSATDCIFTNNTTSVTNIKIVCNWCTSIELHSEWSKMCKNTEKRLWNNVCLYDYDDYDYLIILNWSDEVDVNTCDFSKVILIQMEPNTVFHPLWNKYIQNPSLKYIITHKSQHNTIGWSLVDSYSELSKDTIQKTKQFGVYLEQNYREIGSARKIDLVYQLIKSKVNIDVYGHDYFGVTKGKTLPLKDYKYVIISENSFHKHYITYRLVDAILSECLIFYSGDYTIGEILPTKSFVWIDNLDPEYVIKYITTMIENDEYTKRLSMIKEAKNKILNELQFFPQIESVLKKIK